jgi:hypothetical protein
VRTDALSRLRRGETEVRLSSAVKEVGKDYVLLSSGERLPCGLVVWFVRPSTDPSRPFSPFTCYVLLRLRLHLRLRLRVPSRKIPVFLFTVYASLVARASLPVPFSPLAVAGSTGVGPRAFVKASSLSLNARGSHIAVDDSLRVLNAQGRVFALGDTASIEFPVRTPLPAIAQVAEQQGAFLAEALNKGFVQQVADKPVVPHAAAAHAVLVNSSTAPDPAAAASTTLSSPPRPASS